MAITNTTISDLVPNEKVLAGTVDLLMKDANEIVNSGLAVRGVEVDAVAGGGPRKASIPFVNPLATTDYNIGNDDINDAGNVGKMTADEFSAIRHDINYGWGYADLARMVTTYDTQGGIAAGIAQYWASIYQQLAVSSIKGAGAVNSGLTFGDGTDALAVAMLVDAAATAEMYSDMFDILIVSPATKAKLRKLNAGNTFVPASESNIKFDTFAGYKLLTSKAFGNTTSVLARSGALSFGEGTPAGMVPVEIERVANGGNGQGASILHSRRSVVIHPQGFGYTGAVAPTKTNLEDSTKWELVVPVEQVGFRFIDHT